MWSFSAIQPFGLAVAALFQYAISTCLKRVQKIPYKYLYANSNTIKTKMKQILNKGMHSLET